MDNRRPVRPPQQQTSRRPLFNTAASRSKPTTTNSKTVHIASEASHQDEDLVERDPSGNYKVIGPTTAMKMGVDRGLDVDDEEKEQEDQMIALYGKQNVHWDQAGMFLFPLSVRFVLTRGYSRHGRGQGCAEGKLGEEGTELGE